MMAIGCLFPVLFFLGGAVLGGVLGGQQGSIWGAVAGLIIGLGIPTAMLIGMRSRHKH
ncbi:hypothetical protein KY084_06490 [Stakelama sp. CBK3Z-3]|uniref:SoxR reducing system RseC family protein n=1 Tax=Stakelama flava TaxID=2860338 RepID=A0ABS6XJZ8_9SPHN|nr:hypothetical protein [Stakelama flava]MBW4330522.1 hypothetical protein [Stakelama flava]